MPDGKEVDSISGVHAVVALPKSQAIPNIQTRSLYYLCTNWSCGPFEIIVLHRTPNHYNPMLGAYKAENPSLIRMR